MELKHCSVQEFAHRTADKKIICFGAYVMPLSLCREYEEYHFEDRILYLADNDQQKQGKEFTLPGGKKRKIISARQLVELADNDTVLIITSDYFAAIIEQLDKYPQLDHMHCYIYPFMKYDMGHTEQIPARHSTTLQIPKTIHCIWFGKKPKTGLMEQCICSWKKYCPDYEIIEWNEDNYDISKNPFMKASYDAGKYGCVSDYARLDIVCQYGGIYFDTDVEVIKNIDSMLYNEAFFGFGNYGRVATGLGFGAVKQHKVVKKLLEAYGSFTFDQGAGLWAQATNTIREEPVFLELGLKPKDMFQTVGGASIFPSDFMAPMIPGFCSSRITCNTITIHHNRFSWASKEQLQEFQKSGNEYENIRRRFQEGEAAEGDL